MTAAATAGHIRHTRHDIRIEAPPDVVYQVIAEAAGWPVRFPPNLHVEQVPLDATTERLHIWAIANGAVKSWTSRRQLDPPGRRIEFQQEVSAPPVASMTGTWIVEPESHGATRLTLTHDFTAVDDDPSDLDWIEQAVDRNSGQELEGIRTVALGAAGPTDPSHVFADSVRIRGTASRAYDFIARADLWPQRLPHVASLEMREEPGGIQQLAMETRARDGSTHTTVSIRICLPDELRVLYKQTVTPALMTAHTGEWTFVQDGDEVLATSKHSVLVNESMIGAILGPDADLDTAKAYLRSALGANSLATLNLAKAHLEFGGGAT
jgi:ribosome-associated toxin RatA of RatAB toxin-antitoxin module